MSAKRTGYALKPEYQKLEDEFVAYYGDEKACYCHTIMPPCACCTHEGHPLNLEENDDAWENELLSEVRAVVEDNQ